MPSFYSRSRAVRKHSLSEIEWAFLAARSSAGGQPSWLPVDSPHPSAAPGTSGVALRTQLRPCSLALYSASSARRRASSGFSRR
jgi:hypothetical protein